jgi:hypothetical protein
MSTHRFTFINGERARTIRGCRDAHFIEDMLDSMIGRLLRDRETVCETVGKTWLYVIADDPP